MPILENEPCSFENISAYSYLADNILQRLTQDHLENEPCSFENISAYSYLADNILQRLTASTSLIALILFYFTQIVVLKNTHKHVDAFRAFDQKVNCNNWRANFFN